MSNYIRFPHTLTTLPPDSEMTSASKLIQDEAAITRSLRGKFTQLGVGAEDSHSLAEY